MLSDGAHWAVAEGYGRPEDLERIEDDGRAADAAPAHVSQKARDRQRDEMGTLGSRNHYLEVQRVADVLAADVADAFELLEGEIVVSIHCGSRGLGHQIGTDYLGRMASGRWVQPRGPDMVRSWTTDSMQRICRIVLTDGDT